MPGHLHYFFACPLTYSMKYSVRHSLQHSGNCGVTTISRGCRGLGFCLERGLAVHSFIYYISPMLLVVGPKLRSGVYDSVCITA